jgi:hypothetical protein
MIDMPVASVALGGTIASAAVYSTVIYRVREYPRHTHMTMGARLHFL